MLTIVFKTKTEKGEFHRNSSHDGGRGREGKMEYYQKCTEGINMPESAIIMK